MFSIDSDPERWAAGMAASFEKFEPEVVELYLNAIYLQAACGRSKPLFEGLSSIFVPQVEVLGALELAHMLDAPRIKTLFEDYIISTISDYCRMHKSVLDVAFRCSMARLQGVCLTEALMDIVSGARFQRGHWKRSVSEELTKLFSYEIDPEVRQRLNKAMVELIISAVVGSSGTAFPGLGKEQIESIMIVDHS